MVKQTVTAAEIIATNIGYRNDALFSGDDYLIHDVLDWEMHELQNTDILDYLNLSHFDDVIDYVKQHFGTDEVYGYWFTTKQNVIDLYHGDTEDMTQFELPSDYLILSDLDDDGILIVSQTPKSALEQHIIVN